jgi:hypothetical protein
MSSMGEKCRESGEIIINAPKISRVQSKYLDWGRQSLIKEKRQR